jgi:hypothetical protein
MSDGEQSDDLMETDAPLDQSVEEITNDPELSYAIKSSRRSLLQHVAQQTPTCTFAQLRETHGPQGGLAILSSIIFSCLHSVLGGCNATVNRKRCGQPILWGCLVRLYCDACFLKHSRSKRANCGSLHSQVIAEVVASRLSRATMMNATRMKRKAEEGPTPSKPAKRARSSTGPVSDPTSALQAINAPPFSLVWTPSVGQFKPRSVRLPMGALSLPVQPRSETLVSEIMTNVVGGAALSSAQLSALTA